MKNRFMLKLIGLLIAIIALIVASSVIAFAEDIPFFCDTAISARQRIDREELLSCYFYQQDYIYRTDAEAIDFYTSTERTACIYDDGDEALFTSDSGYYFANIIDDTTAKIYAFLQTEYGVRNSEYGNMSLSTYKSNDGFWVLGNMGDYNNGLFYIDRKNEKCYFRPIDRLSIIRLSTSDRYLMIFTNEYNNTFIVIDRDTCEAQLFTLFSGIDIVPYFDKNGIASMIVNSKYESDEQDYRPDFYLYNEYYYYSWEMATIYKVKYKNYDYVCYVDSDSIIVEDEFYFVKIQNAEAVWKISKKDIVKNQAIKYLIQEGVLWQYGNGLSDYYTYLVPMEQTLMDYAFNEPTEKIELSYFVGWSGRYSDCHNYDLTDHSIDHKSVFDQLNNKVVSLYMYHRNNRIYNQDHVLWDKSLVYGMEGDYGVYNFKDNSYYQRFITQ